MFLLHCETLVSLSYSGQNTADVWAVVIPVSAGTRHRGDPNWTSVSAREQHSGLTSAPETAGFK
jgi:hypothetical protein